MGFNCGLRTANYAVLLEGRPEQHVHTPFPTAGARHGPSSSDPHPVGIVVDPRDVEGELRSRRRDPLYRARIPARARVREDRPGEAIEEERASAASREGNREPPFDGRRQRSRPFPRVGRPAAHPERAARAGANSGQHLDRRTTLAPYGENLRRDSVGPPSGDASGQHVVRVARQIERLVHGENAERFSGPGARFARHPALSAEGAELYPVFQGDGERRPSRIRPSSRHVRATIGWRAATGEVETVDDGCRVGAVPKPLVFATGGDPRKGANARPLEREPKRYLTRPLEQRADGIVVRIDDGERIPRLRGNDADDGKPQSAPYPLHVSGELLIPR